MFVAIVLWMDWVPVLGLQQALRMHSEIRCGAIAIADYLFYTPVPGHCLYANHCRLFVCIEVCMQSV